jgi:hypothetical protein
MSVNAGGTQALSISPDTGYQIQDVLVDGESFGDISGCTFSIINANHTLISTFVLADNNHPPVFIPISDKTLIEGRYSWFVVKAKDADNDKLTYSASNMPRGAMFWRNMFIWRPLPGQAGTYTVTFTASDGKTTSSINVNITVVANAFRR